ncbi:MULTISPECIES: FtsK/SpoIIIE domain-containing protein [Pseudanabaena]|uniref:Cell division FtsK/SpoIIIE n=2 Tax=Pseudanabaena TaxID=1152 RepID=L8N2B0_9CYAN|nr:MULTISPECIES: FtsK/SpoIIIE domain-containing protein [Pseudanabaena]ELS33821.1 cell division FtsK/SpoIIIE [Pseudanabaena biceps PCC 7429]MDG3493981.1 FtsK/SpoIIIE domain-containing protein [Pseudanabaena catenata USMAC16]
MANIIKVLEQRGKAEDALESLQRDKSRYIEVLNDLERTSQKKLKATEESWEEKLQFSADDHEQQIKTSEEDWNQKISNKRGQLGQEAVNIREALAKRLSRVLAFIKITEKVVNETLTDNFTNNIVETSQLLSSTHLLLDRLVTVVDGEIKPLETSSRQITVGWNDERWWNLNMKNAYTSRTEGLAPFLVRMGKLCEIVDKKSKFSVDLSNTDLVENLFEDKSIAITLDQLPLLLQYRTFKQGQDSGHIAIFTNSPETRQAATAALESIALRAIATFPARKLQGIFIDPVSMGNTFPFKSLPEEIRGKRTYTTSDDIQEQLHKLIGHTEQVIQNYLSRDYDNIEAYNAAAEAIQEAYRYLFIADFPSKFDNKSFEYLNSLLVNGSRAGVYTIIHIDETLEKPRNFNYDLFKAHCQVLRPADRSYNGEPLFVYESPETQIVCYATLDKPPESDRFNQLTAMISKACGEVKVDTVAFSQLYPETLWTSDSRGEIRTAIGVAGAREKLEFWLGQNPKGLEVSQSLLFGKPGAGKSYTLHSIINGLAMRYAPDELELYLLDFKEGVEFQVYVDPDRGEDSGSSNDLDLTKALPHAKVISIESDREFGLSVLRKVNEQFQIRANEWKSISNDITKVAEYRNKTNGKKMPRILIVIDEFQVLFEDNDSISAELNQIFDTIVKKGRAFGIHLLLASQSPNIKNITRSVYDLIDLRMAMQMNQNVAAMTLAEGNTDAVDLLDRPGRIIYNSDFGRKGSNEIGQVADASTGERKKALRKIQETVQATGYQRPPTDQLVVFDGRHPTRLRNNGLLTVLASADTWLSPADIKDIVNESNWRVRDFPSIAWVGEAMQIGYHSRAIFRRRSRSNMLLVGNIEENIFGILGGVLTSLVSSHQPQKAEFHIIDLSDEDDRGSHWSSMTLNFREAFSSYFPITIAKDFADSDRHISKANTTLQNIHAEFERRKQLREVDPDTTNFGASIFFVAAIGTLERLNSLRPTVDNRGNPDMSDDAKKLMAIASQGSELGIHLILWVEGIKTLNQLFAGKERISLSNFDLRIGLTMPADDSRTLFNETLATSLTKLRAYFKDEATAANLEKFKPYAVPTKQEFAIYANYLSKKA